MTQGYPVRWSTPLWALLQEADSDYCRMVNLQILSNFQGDWNRVFPYSPKYLCYVWNAWASGSKRMWTKEYGGGLNLLEGTPKNLIFSLQTLCYLHRQETIKSTAAWRGWSCSARPHASTLITINLLCCFSEHCWIGDKESKSEYRRSTDHGFGKLPWSPDHIP